jgi:3-oxoadipate enol-lactonase
MLIEANGIEINYRLEGPDGRPGLPGTAAEAPGTVTLSHSLATTLEMWDPQMESLASRRRVLRFDTRGHGKSSAPAGPYTFELLVEDVRGLLLGLGVTQTHFVGLSLGGMIGQLLAATYPDMVSSLVLCDTAYRVDPLTGPLWDERIATAQSVGMEPLADATMARWFTPGFVGAHPEVVGPVRAMIRNTEPRGYAGCAHAVKNLDLEGRLGDIHVPTLIVVGEDDPGTPVEVARAIQERIAGAELVVLPSASHLSNVEQPNMFNRVVTAFLDRVDRRRGS